MCIQESHKQDKKENEDLGKSRHADPFYRYGPGIHKDELYIEDEEDQRIQVVSHIELIPGGSGGWDAAFISLPLVCVLSSLYKEAGSGDAACCKCNSGKEQN